MKTLAGLLRPERGGEAQPLEAREVLGAPCCQSTKLAGPETLRFVRGGDSPEQIGQTWMHSFLSAFRALGFFFLLASRPQAGAMIPI